MRDPLLDTTGIIVGVYEREYYCFSNFSSFAVEWKERVWPTLEHVYQAAKFMETDPVVVETIFHARSAHDTKQIAKKHQNKIPSDWDFRRLAVMEDLCRHKLGQHKFIQMKLLETGRQEIVEDSPKDSFWGWGPNRDGRNELGKIWMKLRDELRSQQNLQR